ncbi:squalene/phytoene synthase family protein [Pseudoroseicyclus aestuarii]|uniref:Squalene synthase HpnC n=1 Tax=Pseudoroseicyclus aestuarii TaxID=1795041 RepID=A0A318T3L5_9RHOB|nr:squalene/phytoene synthase family protein [Pseudoroseicyclus aestuarii]PYE80891.1 squalene synthase HpnC [Pseudoroseicyclus aestuarii]
MSRGENFPVASLLIRRDLRPLMQAFYAVARGADDAADNPAASPEQRLAALDRVEAGLDGTPGGAPEALSLRRLTREAGREALLAHPRALLVAFRADATGAACADWDALMGYCRHSAVPVGRFILDLHDEGAESHDAADALCSALQVLNHLQDLRQDYTRLGRVYLPLDWIAAAGETPEALRGAALTPGLRQAVDRALQQTAVLLARAEALPGLLRARRLRGEVRSILHLARHLHAQLARHDPLAGRVAPSSTAMARSAVLGAASALAPRRAASGRLRAEAGR